MTNILTSDGSKGGSPVTAAASPPAADDECELNASANSTANIMRPFSPLAVAELFQPRWRKRTIMLWLFRCLQTLGYYGFGTLVPLVLTAKGYDVVPSLTYSAVTFIGYLVGSLLSLPIIERSSAAPWSSRRLPR